MNRSTINPVRKLCLLLVFISVAACTVKLVQPYDADLYSNTEAFYKRASAMIAKGINVSPKLQKNIQSIPDESKKSHPGNYNQFKDDYDALLIDSNSLILRSLSNSGQIDAIGRDIQTKIEEAITSNFPVSCDSLQSNFPDVSLTTRNYIDLKCLIGRWATEHEEKKVLKKSNWEGRERTLFESILAIQRSEASKKEK